MFDPDRISLAYGAERALFSTLVNNPVGLCWRRVGPLGRNRYGEVVSVTVAVSEDDDASEAELLAHAKRIDSDELEDALNEVYGRMPDFVERDADHLLQGGSASTELVEALMQQVLFGRLVYRPIP